MANSPDVKYFAFEYLFHNLYLSWACKYQLQKLRAYVQLDHKYELNLILVEKARGSFYLDVYDWMQYFSRIE